MYHRDLDRCLAVHPENQGLLSRDCNDNDLYQKWTWKEIKPYWAKNQQVGALPTLNQNLCVQYCKIFKSIFVWVVLLQVETVGNQMFSRLNIKLIRDLGNRHITF